MSGVSNRYSLCLYSSVFVAGIQVVTVCNFTSAWPCFAVLAFQTKLKSTVEYLSYSVVRYSCQHVTNVDSECIVSSIGLFLHSFVSHVAGDYLGFISV